MDVLTLKTRRSLSFCGQVQTLELNMSNSRFKDLHLFTSNLAAQSCNRFIRENLVSFCLIAMITDKSNVVNTITRLGRN